MRKISRNTLVVVILCFSGLLGFLLSWYHYGSPGNEVQVIQTFHTPALFVKQLAGDPQAGRKIFKEFCASCHAAEPKIDIKAPRIGDKVVWRQLKKLGMATLLKITIEGAGAMPARGGCFECSDEQLQATIAYILQKS